MKLHSYIGFFFCAWQSSFSSIFYLIHFQYSTLHCTHIQKCRLGCIWKDLRLTFNVIAMSIRTECPITLSSTSWSLLKRLRILPRGVVSKKVIGKRITLTRSDVCKILAAKIVPSENVIDIMNCETTVEARNINFMKSFACDNDDETELNFYMFLSAWKKIMEKYYLIENIT